MTNEEYIARHREEDVRSLALKKMPEGVDSTWCLQQIEGWQLARKKLPQWAATEGRWFPPRISMEQCSSEPTALYKRCISERLIPKEERTKMVDLTGGFGIDFSYMSQAFCEAEYVERQAHLCEIARHNFSIPTSSASITSPKITNSTTEDYLSARLPAALLYLDPARRDDAGRKVVALEECTPNVIDLQDSLLQLARYIIIKLSPMLDITQALRQLKHVCEVHVVSVQGECKEVLLVMEGFPNTKNSEDKEREIAYHCIDIRNERTDAFITTSPNKLPLTLSDSRRALLGLCLFEPNASILKAGVQDALCQCFGIEKLHPNSNLFVGETTIAEFPGRQFIIEDTGDFSKSEIKRVLQGIAKANLTVRNFPATVAELRKKLKLKEGGEDYLFATTLTNEKHILIRSRKPASAE